MDELVKMTLQDVEVVLVVLQTNLLIFNNTVFVSFLFAIIKAV